MMGRQLLVICLCVLFLTPAPAVVTADTQSSPQTPSPETATSDGGAGGGVHQAVAAQDGSPAITIVTDHIVDKHGNVRDDDTTIEPGEQLRIVAEVRNSGKVQLIDKSGLFKLDTTVIEETRNRKRITRSTAEVTFEIPYYQLHNQRDEFGDNLLIALRIDDSVSLPFTWTESRTIDDYELADEDPKPESYWDTTDNDGETPDTGNNDGDRLDPGNLEITSVNIPEETPPGEDMPVSVEVTNTGELSASQFINLSTRNRDGKKMDHVFVAPDDTRTVETDLHIPPRDAGKNLRVTVSTKNDSVSRTVTVLDATDDTDSEDDSAQPNAGGPPQDALDTTPEEPDSVPDDRGGDAPESDRSDDDTTDTPQNRDGTDDDAGDSGESGTSDDGSGDDDNGADGDDTPTSSPTPDSERVQFIEEFESGLNGWRIGLPSGIGPRVTQGEGEWTQKYGGSVRLHVDGGPNHIGVRQRVGALENGTRISAQYKSPNLDGEPGSPRILLHLPDSDETISIDKDPGRGEHDGVLTGTVPRDLPAGTELEIRLGVWPGEITAYVTNVTATSDITYLPFNESDETSPDALGESDGNGELTTNDGTPVEAEFMNCTSAKLTGTFTENHTIIPSLIWFSELGDQPTSFGEFGPSTDEIDPPFTGTIVFTTTGDERRVTKHAEQNRIVEVIPDMGVNGTVITGIMAETGDVTYGDDLTFTNPHDCLDTIHPKQPSVTVSDVARTAEEDRYNVTFEYTNPNNGNLTVDSEFTGSTAADPPTELKQGTHEVAVPWTPDTRSEQLGLTATIGDSMHGYNETVTATTQPASAYAASNPDPGPGNETDDQSSDSETQGDVSLAIEQANTPVDAGQPVEVEAAVTNPGSSLVTKEVRLIVGETPEQVDSTTVTVPPDETTAVTLGYETPPVNNDQTFPVRVETDETSTTQSITVYGTSSSGGGASPASTSEESTSSSSGSESASSSESSSSESTRQSGTAAPSVSITGTNTPLDAGKFLEVTARVTNTGDAPLTTDIALIVGHSPEQVQSKQVTVPPGESTTVSLGYTTPQVKNDQRFPVRVTVGEQIDEQSVLVRGTSE